MTKRYRHIELPEYSLINEWSERMRRIKIHYNVSEHHGLLSDIYMFRKLNVTTHKYIYMYTPSYQFMSDKTEKNIKINTKEEIEALEWILKDFYTKERITIMDNRFKFKLEWAENKKDYKYKITYSFHVGKHKRATERFYRQIVIYTKKL